MYFNIVTSVIIFLLHLFWHKEHSHVVCVLIWVWITLNAHLFLADKADFCACKYRTLSLLLQLGSVVELFNFLKLIICFHVHRLFKMACIFCNQDVQTARSKRKMYVWTCTKENLSCNLSCYNVQYVCIVFNWGTFMQKECFVSSHRHFWSVLLLCHPRFLLFCSFQPPCHSFKFEITDRCVTMLSVLCFDSTVWLILVEVTIWCTN